MTSQQIEQQIQPKAISSLEPLTPEQVQKTIDMLDEWMTDESGYDEETWPALKAALDKERDIVSAERLFNE
ncbi:MULTISPECIES: hypothetical protein [Kamptonema]|uniref:hypothetical protein n=1 Tax=Kamptonema TaxID=1501433 RepID=UPI0001DAC7DB|nr:MULTISPECIES: hypothetical protein [Kamptonema]CBN54392.1 hypothetical protein OSCI_860005 [Kamptonema sp. PCC 6506]